jgi:hypothetical protein
VFVGQAMRTRDRQLLELLPECMFYRAIGFAGIRISVRG